jgi:hypothetical protein
MVMPGQADMADMRGLAMLGDWGVEDMRHMSNAGGHEASHGLNTSLGMV